MKFNKKFIENMRMDIREMAFSIFERAKKNKREVSIYKLIQELERELLAKTNVESRIVEAKMLWANKYGNDPAITGDWDDYS